MSLEQLAAAVREKRALLFVGAGVSRNMGLPSFKELVSHLAEELGYDPDIFSTHGDYLELAEYYLLRHRSLESLQEWMDKAWHKDIDIGSSAIHRLIVQLEFPTIYTTNYDSLLELAHERHGRPFRKVAGVHELMSGPWTPNRETQIIKFHGDFKDANTFVLTESQYFERLAFESPLDIRLRSDLLSGVTLFIGHRLSDINIRYMFYKMARLWEASTSSAVRPASFMFLTRPNPVQQALLEARGVTPLVSENDDPGEGLREFLTDLLREVGNGGS